MQPTATTLLALLGNSARLVLYAFTWCAVVVAPPERDPLEVALERLVFSNAYQLTLRGEKPVSLLNYYESWRFPEEEKTMESEDLRGFLRNAFLRDTDLVLKAIEDGRLQQGNIAFLPCGEGPRRAVLLVSYAGVEERFKNGTYKEQLEKAGYTKPFEPRAFVEWIRTRLGAIEMQTEKPTRALQVILGIAFGYPFPDVLAFPGNPEGKGELVTVADHTGREHPLYISYRGRGDWRENELRAKMLETSRFVSSEVRQQTSYRELWNRFAAAQPGTLPLASFAEKCRRTARRFWPF